MFLLSLQKFPQQLLGQVCEKEGELVPQLWCCNSFILGGGINDDVTSVWGRQVLDKYGDIYGRERIAELLGMDLASLDVSAMTHEKKPEPDTSMFSW